MGTLKDLFELQQLDIEINEKVVALNKINALLSSNEVLLRAEDELLKTREQLTEVTQQKRDNEYAVSDLQKNIKRVHDKLFNGKITNPKELRSYELESEALTKNLKEKEDILLNLMADEENMQKLLAVKNSQLEKLKEENQIQHNRLLREKEGLELLLSELQGNRKSFAGNIELQVVTLYEDIKSRKGRAVAKVEQGRCQGCRINLSSSEWQKTKGGAIIQCSSCGMILYLG